MNSLLVMRMGAVWQLALIEYISLWCMAVNGCCDLELGRAHQSKHKSSSTLIYCSGTNFRFLSFSNIIHSNNTESRTGLY